MTGEWSENQNQVNDLTELPNHLMKKTPAFLQVLDLLAEWTGLEPATPGVTGRYSNQLNYHSKTIANGIDTNSNTMFKWH